MCRILQNFIFKTKNSYRRFLCLFVFSGILGIIGIPMTIVPYSKRDTSSPLFIIGIVLFIIGVSLLISSGVILCINKTVVPKQTERRQQGNSQTSTETLTQTLPAYPQQLEIQRQPANIYPQQQSFLQTYDNLHPSLLHGSQLNHSNVRCENNSFVHAAPSAPPLSISVTTSY